MNGANEHKWGETIPRQQKQEPIPTNEDDNIVLEQNKYTKRGLFNKKKKQDKPSTLTSEHIWREINLFIPELIAILVAIFIGGGTVLFTRLFSATGLEAIRPMLTEQGYLEAAGLISNLNSIALVGIAVPILVLLAFFLIRFTMFQPKRGRFFTLRFMRTGAIRLSIDKFKDEMPFSKEAMSDKVKITDPRAHFEEKTGKPLLLLFEGDDRNANLKGYGSSVTTKGKDSNTINDMAIDYGRRIERFLAESKDNFLSPQNILLIIIVAMVGLALFLLLRNPETTAQLLGAAPVGLMFP